MPMYSISGSAFPDYPVELVYGLVYTDENVLEIPKACPFSGVWGSPQSPVAVDINPDSFPIALEICYLSIIERKFYLAQIEFPDNLFDSGWMQDVDQIIFGMAPKGNIAMWVRGERKSILVLTIEAIETEIESADIFPYNPTLSVETFCKQYCKTKITDSSLSDIFNSAVKQYNYQFRITAIHNTNDEHDEHEAHWQFGEIEVAREDGSFNKTQDGQLFKYSMSGLPKMLSFKASKLQTEYKMCLWFDYAELKPIFDRFYGAHPETKTDFIIRIDAENKKYELALYRQGLKEPVVISESAYQLIVFKNKFEDYRSENYNQPRGAWIW